MLHDTDDTDLRLYFIGLTIVSSVLLISVKQVMGVFYSQEELECKCVHFHLVLEEWVPLAYLACNVLSYRRRQQIAKVQGEWLSS